VVCLPEERGLVGRHDVHELGELLAVGTLLLQKAVVVHERRQAERPQTFAEPRLQQGAIARSERDPGVGSDEGAEELELGISQLAFGGGEGRVAWDQ
jgi:hypothetical protein